MKTKSKYLFLFAAALAISGFFIFSSKFAPQAQALCAGSGYNSNWTYNGTSDSPNSTCDSNFNVYNSTPNGGNSGGWTSAINYSNSNGWLSISPSSGSVAASDINGNPGFQTVSINVSGAHPGNNQTWSATINISPTAGSLVGPSTITVNVTNSNATGSSCNITSFSAAPSSVNPNQVTTLSWTSTGCSGNLTLNGGQYNNSSVGQNTSTTTNGLTNTTTYTLSGVSNQGVQTSANVTVTVIGNCTLVVNSTGNPNLGFNYYFSGPNNFSGTGNNSYSGKTPGQYTITYTGGANKPFSSYTPSQTQTCPSGGSVTFTLNFVAGSSCIINAPAASNVAYNTAATLTWSSSGCSGNLTLNGGQYNNASVGQNSSVTTNPLTVTTAYSWDGVDGSGNPTSAYTTVTVNSACTITVSSTGNPSAFYAYSLSGPNNFSGIGDNSYAGKTPGQYTITYTGGANKPFSSYTPSQTQTCPVNSTVTFTLNFVGLPPSPPTAPNGNGTNPIAYNTVSGGSGVPVACGQIKVVWGQVSNADSYNVYRGTSPATLAMLGNVANIVGQPNNSYLDQTPAQQVTYYYAVQSVNVNGTSAQVLTNAVMASQCQVDLSTADKVITSVNNQSYSYNSACIGTQSGTVNTIKVGDVLRMSINICNTGTNTANNVVATDDLSNTNLALHNPPNVTGASMSQNGNVLTFTVGSLASNTKAVIAFDVDVVANGSTQNLLRLRNIANVTYTSSGGNGATGCIGSNATSSNPCTLDTGYVVFYNGSKAPTIKEINP